MVLPATCSYFGRVSNRLAITLFLTSQFVQWAHNMVCCFVWNWATWAQVRRGTTPSRSRPQHLVPKPCNPKHWARIPETRPDTPLPNHTSPACHGWGGETRWPQNQIPPATPCTNACPTVHHELVCAFLLNIPMTVHIIPSVRLTIPFSHVGPISMITDDSPCRMFVRLTRV